MKIKYKGAEIFFSTYGKGNPLVLLHGFLEDSEIWKEVVDEVKNERQVICIDLPGHGKSEGFSDVHTMAEMANVVMKVLESIGCEKISIVGHSMGGYVSLEFYNKFPMMVKSLVLINSTPVDDSVEKRENREKSARLVARNKKAYVNMAISNLFSEESKKKFIAEIENLKNRALQMEIKNIQAALQGMKIRTNHIDLFKSASLPKIVVAGKQDPILEFSDLQRISKECNARLFSTENGHNSYIEDSENLRKIVHFID